MVWNIAVDTGGTFTDCLGYSPEGRIERAKVLSSGALRVRVGGRIGDRTLLLDLPWDLPKDFFMGFRMRLAGPTDHDFEIAQCDLEKRQVTLCGPIGEGFPNGTLVEFFTGEEPPIVGARMLTGTPGNQPLPPLALRLGTTRGTNALLEEKGSKVALFVTRGFQDLLLIGDQKRPDLFALNIIKPEPLYHHVEEIDERIAADGAVLRSLDLKAAKIAAQQALRVGCDAAAISLLNSFRNPVHERVLHDFLLDLGFKYVVCSENLSPLIKYLERTQTAVVDAYLGPLMGRYLNRVEEAVAEGALTVMTSAGGLVPRNRYRSKDSLLSGPAGGVVGAVAAGARAGMKKIIPFDMGGTSADVSRFDGEFEYRESHRVGRALLMAPALPIETVASGGGSICGFDGEALFVGPKSAGANPGPACYGSGGPLCLTDVHLLLGRLNPDSFGIPVFEEDAAKRFAGLLAGLPGRPGARKVLKGFLDIANERMADAIRRISLREGYDPGEYSLVAFGGAGGMHACSVAERLGIKRILFPGEAGLLSARGLSHAVVDAFAERQLLRPYSEIAGSLEKILLELENEAIGRLTADGWKKEYLIVRNRFARLRFLGQESSFVVAWEKGGDLLKQFEKRYRSIFGYFPSARKMEVVSLQVIAATPDTEIQPETFSESGQKFEPAKKTAAGSGGWGMEMPLFNSNDLLSGSLIEGPTIITDAYSTLVIESGWKAVVGSGQFVLLEKLNEFEGPVTGDLPEVVQRELFTHRFRQIVEEMGTQLRRTALSTNIKERLDFSCGLLDPEGRLVVNAPHIPVHLGALGLCVREVAKGMDFSPGDIILTNHPAFGGSHLPDVTLITPVFMGDGKNDQRRGLLGFVANRAHHAEIGGTRPGSMPPEAHCLAEEGVVLAPFKLFAAGRENFGELERLLQNGPWPTRAIEDNLADIKAQVAANIRGAAAFQCMAKNYGTETVSTHLNALRERAARLMKSKLASLSRGPMKARQILDDGHVIEVCLRCQADVLTVDFSGTSPVHGGNLNATPAIVNSALIYVLRLLLEEKIPLNEGLLEPVRVILPECFLNPVFGLDPEKAPAVGGGNVETSQRIVDTLLLALGVAAASQGTMNNLVFGDESFSYYETICGGSGATETAPGASAVHTHMTNTAITDPEILEHRYPVRLRRFEIRAGSGGHGKRQGGDGVVREIEFLRQSQLSLLTQRRASGPYGMAGGSAGKPGKQYLVSKSGKQELLLPLDCRNVQPGDRLVIKTPGGGGWGVPRVGGVRCQVSELDKEG